jgi:Stress responsive A/B Barrel Domain
MQRRRFATIATVAGVLCVAGFLSVRFISLSRAIAQEHDSRFTAAKEDVLKDPATHTPVIAHMVFFTLKESTAENRKKLINAAKEYLGGHPGEIYFSVGEVADLKEPVSMTDFDVAVHILFESRAAHDQYLTSARHKQFSAVSHKLDKSVRVFDSTLEPDDPAAKK